MNSRQVLCSRKVKLVADALIRDVKDVQYDLIALPVGSLAPTNSPCEIS